MVGLSCQGPGRRQGGITALNSPGRRQLRAIYVQMASGRGRVACALGETTHRALPLRRLPSPSLSAAWASAPGGRAAVAGALPNLGHPCPLVGHVGDAREPLPGQTDFGTGGRQGHSHFLRLR